MPRNVVNCQELSPPGSKKIKIPLQNFFSQCTLKSDSPPQTELFGKSWFLPKILGRNNVIYYKYDYPVNPRSFDKCPAAFYNGFAKSKHSKIASKSGAPLYLIVHSSPHMGSSLNKHLGQVHSHELFTNIHSQVRGLIYF